MSLLGNLAGGLAGQVLGGLGGGQQAQLLQLATGLVTQNGGLDGLVKMFAQNGLGNIVNSWVSKGQNMPISGDQITQVFGANKIQELAQQTGLAPNNVSSGLASILPNVVDKLTPDGASVGGNVLEQGIAGLLEGGIGGLFK